MIIRLSCELVHMLNCCCFPQTAMCCQLTELLFPCIINCDSRLVSEYTLDVTLICAIHDIIGVAALSASKSSSS